MARGGCDSTREKRLLFCFPFVSRSLKWSSSFHYSILILTLEAWSLWALRFARPRFVSLESLHFPISFWYIVAITWVAFVALNEVRQLKEKMSLFSSSSSRSQSKNLVEFRAGKMTMRGNMVHPDKRKGLVYIHQSSDSLIHFCWKDRQSGSVEDVCLNICSFLVHILILVSFLGLDHFPWWLWVCSSTSVYHWTGFSLEIQVFQ